MAATLYSCVLKIDAETLDRIREYTTAHNLRLTVNTRDSKDLPYWVVVWGTRLELNEFNRYF